MRDARVYIIRQCILDGAAAMEGIPFSLDDLLAFPKLRALHVSREEVQAQWAELAAYGFIAEIPESDHQYARITSAGLAQAPGRIEGARDQRVWGAAAF